MTADARRTTDDSLVVDTVSGPVRGIDDGTVKAWKGIRYAAPPVGDLRWRAPEPPAPLDRAGRRHQGRPGVPAADRSADPDRPRRAAGRRLPDAERVGVVGYRRGRRQAGDGVGARRRLHPRLVGAAAVPRPYAGGGRRRGDRHGELPVRRARVPTWTCRRSATGSPPTSACATCWPRCSGCATTSRGSGETPTVSRCSANPQARASSPRCWPAPPPRACSRRDRAELTGHVDLRREPRRRVAARSSTARGGRDDVDRLAALPTEAIAGRVAGTCSTRCPVHTPGTLAFAPIVDGDIVPDYPVKLARTGRTHPVPLIIGTNKHEAALFRWMKSPLMPITPKAIRAMFAEIAAEQPGPAAPGEEQIGATYRGRRQDHRHGRRARHRVPDAVDLVRRRPQRRRAGLPVPLRLRHPDAAAAAPRRRARHRIALRLGQSRRGPKDPTFKLGGLKAGKTVSERIRARWLNFAVEGGARGPARRSGVAALHRRRPRDPGHRRPGPGGRRPRPRPARRLGRRGAELPLSRMLLAEVSTWM